VWPHPPQQPPTLGALVQVIKYVFGFKWNKRNKKCKEEDWLVEKCQDHISRFPFH
jgi:hypothetical protein